MPLRRGKERSFFPAPFSVEREEEKQEQQVAERRRALRSERRRQAY